MTKRTLLVALTLILGAIFTTQAQTKAKEKVTKVKPEEKLSKMVIIIKDPKKLESAVAELRKMEGIKKVEIEKQEKLIIYYDKKTLGCCSKIYKTLGKVDAEYTLVSNEEYPKCSHHEGKKHEKHTKASCCKKGSKTHCSHKHKEAK